MTVGTVERPGPPRVRAAVLPYLHKVEVAFRSASIVAIDHRGRAVHPGRDRRRVCATVPVHGDGPLRMGVAAAAAALAWLVTINAWRTIRPRCCSPAGWAHC